MMGPEIVAVDPASPDAAVIARAAALLKQGELIAIPTETVYGLAANALDVAAVQRIFEAKGRPASNPVIVHTFNAESARALAGDWPESARKLAAAFWPGPLTLVLQTSAIVPAIVTAGGPTVALRVPGHAVARAVIEAAGTPLAAPSANVSEGLSPTRAEHVVASLGGRLAMVLDAGPCTVGIESTVIDLTGDRPRILRPGMITAAMIEAVVGPLDTSPLGTAIARSPGQMAKHYAPRAPVCIASEDCIDDIVRQAEHHGPIVMIRIKYDSNDHNHNKFLTVITMPDDAIHYATVLYMTLHEADRAQPSLIIIESPPETAEWAAVHDRLSRMGSWR
jgi:L-threonylcarbamoyladenylate synthase